MVSIRKIKDYIRSVERMTEVPNGSICSIYSKEENLVVKQIQFDRVVGFTGSFNEAVKNISCKNKGE